MQIATQRSQIMHNFTDELLKVVLVFPPLCFDYSLKMIYSICIFHFTYCNKDIISIFFF